MRKIVNFFRKHSIIVICVFVFVINAVCTIFMKAPVITDENGTMANAAFISGIYDWSEAYSSSVSMYWGYGYSILWIPLFYIFSNVFVVYRCIGIINSLVVAFIPLLVYNFLKINFSFLSKKTDLILAFLLGLHPISFVFSKHAWNEPMLLLLQWIILYLLFVCCRKNGLKKIVYRAVLGIACAYSCTVHERCINFGAVIIVTGLLIFILTKDKAISFISFLISFIIGYKLHGIFKSYVVANLIVSDAARNTTESLISKELFNTLLDFQNLKQMIIGMLCQMYYIVFSSFGLLWISIFSFFVLLYFLFKKKNEEFSKPLLTLSIYTNALFAATLIISTIFYYKSYITNTARGVEYYFYGRYNESCMGIIMLLGVIFILSMKPKLQKIAWGISLAGMTLLAVMILVFLKLKILFISNQMFNEINMYFLLPFGTSDIVENTSLHDFIIISCIFIIITIAIWCLLYKKWYKVLLGLVCVLYSIVNIYHTLNYLIPRNDAQYKNVKELINYIEENPELLKDVENIYLTNVGTRTLTMQFVFPEYNLHFLNTKTYGYKQLENIQDNSLVISMKNEGFDKWLEDFYYIDGVYRYHFWKYDEDASKSEVSGSNNKEKISTAYRNEHEEYLIVVNDYQSGSAVLSSSDCIATQTCIFLNDGNITFPNRTFLAHEYEFNFVGNMLDNLNIAISSDDGLVDYDIISEVYSDGLAKIVIDFKQEIMNGEITISKEKENPYSTFRQLQIVPLCD